MRQSHYHAPHCRRAASVLTVSLLFATVLAAAAPEAHAASGNDLLYSRGARMQQAPSVDLRVNWFKDAHLEELREFDGYQISLDATWPLSPKSQVRVVLPVFTKGDGTFFYDNVLRPEHLDVEGNGGTFEFPSLVYERQIREAGTPDGWNIAYAFGLGSVAEPLDVYFNDVNVDRFNHKGFKAILGLMAENNGFAGASRFVGNINLDLYSDTDDLNPSDGNTTFTMLRLSGALQYGHANDGLRPAVELVYSTDLDSYDNLLLVPQVSARPGGGWQLSAGLPMRVTGDGQRKGLDLKIEKFF